MPNTEAIRTLIALLPQRLARLEFHDPEHHTHCTIGHAARHLRLDPKQLGSHEVEYQISRWLGVNLDVVHAIETVNDYGETEPSYKALDRNLGRITGHRQAVVDYLESLIAEEVPSA